MPHDAEPHHHDLKRLVVRGIGWTMASQGAAQVLGLVTAVVIARFLDPREVGLAGMAIVFGNLALVLVEAGFGSLIVQRPQLTEEDKSTAFWAGTALGVALTLLGLALSWPIADLYGQPEVQPLFAVLSLSFLFTALAIVQIGLLTRDLRFRSLEVRVIIATTASCLTAIVFAILGFGSWAIIAQHLVIAALGMLLAWRASPWRPNARFSLASLRGMAGYASNVTGATLLRWGTINVDNLLIGRFLGPAPLGSYTIAFSVMVAPVNRIARPVTQVFFPAFSRMRDPKLIAGTWMRAIRMVALVVVPVTLGMIPVAPDFVRALFGDQWLESIIVIQVLATVGLIQSLVALNEGILESLARTRILFRFTAILSITTVAAFAAGLPWGIEGVAVAYLIVTLLMQPIYVWLTTRVVGLSMWDWLRSIAGVLQAGVAMLAIVFAARELLLETPLPVGLRLAALVVVGVLAYVPLVAWRAPEARSELQRLRRDRQGAPGVPALESPEASG